MLRPHVCGAAVSLAPSTNQTYTLCRDKGNRMKMCALVLLLVAGNIWSARAAEVKRFELNGQDTLTIAVPRTIRVRLDPGEGGAPHLVLSDTNKVCEMRVVL